jgi:hypothetical protein
MAQGLPHGVHVKMDSRRGIAQKFFEATGAELVPFVSDEATWYDFDYLAVHELLELVKARYGISLDEEHLKMPFWSLLDYLEANRQL